MEFGLESIAQLAAQILITALAWYRAQKKNHKDQKMVLDAVQESGQDEAERLLKIENQLQEMAKKYSDLDEKLKKDLMDFEQKIRIDFEQITAALKDQKSTMSEIGLEVNSLKHSIDEFNVLLKALIGNPHE